jgi:hypothetical protein
MATINTDIAESIDIVARAKNSFNLKIDINTSAGSEFDLTGYKVYLDIKALATGSLLRGLTNDTADAYTGNSAYNTTAITLSGGTITIAESSTNMDLAPGTYKYTLRLKSSTDQLKTWMYGKFKINAD